MRSCDGSPANNRRKGILAKCVENEELADFMLKKLKEMSKQNPNGMGDNIEKTLSKAFSNLCSSKTPIRNLKDFSQIKGVGNWILKLMKDFFKSESMDCEPEDLTHKGKKAKVRRRYVPQKNSVPYALLITLYRKTCDEFGNDFMHKQELIDAAEASGLSRVPIAPELGKGKAGPGPFTGSAREWYSGWSSMKTLIGKGLVVKSNLPAKYMLTKEGKEAARECINRSGLPDPLNDVSNSEAVMDNPRSRDMSDDEVVELDSDVEEILLSPRDRAAKRHCLQSDSRSQKKTSLSRVDMDRLMEMGYTKEEILRAHREISDSPDSEDKSLTWISVLCHLKGDGINGLESRTTRKETPKSTNCDANVRIPSHKGGETSFSSFSRMSSSSFMEPCSSSVPRSSPGGITEAASNVLSMPPLSFGERFENVYDVILILDDREHFAKKGSRSKKFIDNICSEFKILIEVRRLPIGDGIWIARHKSRGSEYVLDFIVERKGIEDLRSSIRDNRYKDQKLRLLRCGLKKLIYLVEGEVNASEAAESIKTACFTTEILEGFDVQRSLGLGDTVKKYGYLTRTISQYYKSQTHEESSNKSFSRRLCPHFSEFLKKCEELEKLTVNDLFAIQLMQVSQVTEDIAMVVVDLYPTIMSLATAYSVLDGDVRAQEAMLRNQSNNVVSVSASRNIFNLVWGN